MFSKIWRQTKPRGAPVPPPLTLDPEEKETSSQTSTGQTGRDRETRDLGGPSLALVNQPLALSVHMFEVSTCMGAGRLTSISTENPARYQVKLRSGQNVVVAKVLLMSRR